MNLRNIRDIGRPVLSDRNIIRMVSKCQLFANELKKIQVQPNSVDLTLGTTWERPLPNSEFEGRPCVDMSLPGKKITGEFRTDPKTGKKFYPLEPGEFILMASNEILKIPNGYMGFVQGRSSIARLGISSEEAGLIDSGFYGTITFEVENKTKDLILVPAGLRIGQIHFLKSQYAEMLYSTAHGSKYNGQIEATGSKIHLDPEFRT